jgi:conjugative relaxase-like TrwC/TraI family protein
MLSIGKLGAGQERYYTAKVAEGAEDYYSGEGEAEGYWLGDAAADLGLQGKVDADQLTAMLTGHDPATGAPLGLRHVGGRGPVPGFDLTFSAPKSVSLLWALGGPEIAGQVREAQRESLAAAFNYMQREACWTRRGHGGAEFVRGNGFLAAAFEHRSSRAGDPQLHTHVLIANATRGPDGRWTRLYHPAIYEHAKTAGYLFEAHLRDELTRRLGVRWREVRNGIAEIEGFDPEHLRAFSTRRAEILEAAGEGASARALQVAALDTRRAKERDLTTESLRERWRARAAELGLDREAILRTVGRERPGPTELRTDELGRAVTASRSHFDRRDVVQAVADALPHGAPVAEVERVADALLASEEVIPVSRTPRAERFTTKTVWEIERKALARADRMRIATDRPAVPEVVIARVLATRPSLKADQRQMVERLLADRSGLAAVIGEAGTGKTYALLAAAEGWSAAGVEVRAVAPTWRAANVLRSEGLEATSIARLLAQLDHADELGRPGLPQGSVLLVDEAGMVDSATLARLGERADVAGAKLVLIGDPAQLGEIEAGGLFAAMARRGDPIVLDQVIRHSHELDREAAKLIREGEGAEALAAYRANERVTIATDRDALREEMVADWLGSYREGEDALMIAKRNSEVAELNARARVALRAEGRLGTAEIEVGGERFAAGDQVITRINDHRTQIYNRERWWVAEVDAEARSVVLDGIDTRRRVCVDSVYLERVNESDGSPALQHAYAATTYQAQGATVDTAFVMADPSMDRQEFYVAASRSRGETHFYATPEAQIEREEFAPRSPHEREGLEHIAAAAERDRAQVAAHDEALRSRLAPLSSQELHRLRDELAAEAGAEHRADRSREELTEQIERADRQLDRYVAQAERIGELPRRERGPARDRLEGMAGRAAEQAQSLEGERSQLPPPEHRARAEVAVIEHLLAERERSALLATQIAPPPTSSPSWGRGRPRTGSNARSGTERCGRSSATANGMASRTETPHLERSRRMRRCGGSRGWRGSRSSGRSGGLGSSSRQRPCSAHSRSGSRSERGEEAAGIDPPHCPDATRGCGGDRRRP